MTAKTEPRRSMLVALLIAISPLTVPADIAEPGVQTLEWPDLMPEGWVPPDPMAALNQPDLADLIEGSDEEQQMMQDFTAVRGSSPVVEALNGKRVRLPGFVLPLDFENRQVSEFLLVPYFGACIHVPPPPSNQVVYVKADSPLSVDGLYDPVWVTGTLSTKAHYNDMGDAGYSMAASDIEPYE